MKIRDIIETTATFLGREDMITYLKSNLSNNQTMEKEINVFARAANLVINELATEYVPLKTTEICQSQNGQILYTSLLETPLDILNVYDAFDNKVAFKTTSLYVKTKPEAVRIEYTYIPDSASVNEEIAYREKDVPLRVIAYGTAAEISLIEGKFDEATIWDKRFKESILNRILPKNTVMKGRRFV